MAFRALTVNPTPAHPLVIEAPGGIVDDDILVLWVITDSGSTLTFTPPTDFDPIAGLPILVTADGGQLYVATKKAASEGANYSISNSGAADMTGGVAAFSGRDPTLYLHRTSTPAQQNTPQANPWTLTTDAFSSPTAGQCDLIMIGIDDVTSAGVVAHSPPSGHTVRGEPTNGFHNSFLSSQDAVASGETGVLSAVDTLGGSSSGWACVAIALLVAGGGGGASYTGPYRRQTAFGMFL